MVSLLEMIMNNISLFGPTVQSVRIQDAGDIGSTNRVGIIESMAPMVMMFMMMLVVMISLSLSFTSAVIYAFKNALGGDLTLTVSDS
jgi:hypothetical protein